MMKQKTFGYIVIAAYVALFLGIILATWGNTVEASVTGWGTLKGLAISTIVPFIAGLLIGSDLDE